MADYTFGIGEELQLTAQDGDLIHEWDFGDGTVSVLPRPTHIYNDYGIYTVTHIARDFCDACTMASHTVEITQASITVKSVLLDKYTAKVGDIVAVTIIVQNLSPVFGTNTITLKFGAETVDTYNVTLEPGQETTFTIQHQVTRSGTIDICADNICTVLFVESQITVKSITVNPSVSTGDPVNTTIEVINNGIFIEEKNIKTTLTNIVTAIIDERLLTIVPGGTEIYVVPIDVRGFPNGTYTVCADGLCKAISIAIPAPTGNVNVTSYPSGADIWLDGQNTGFTTPATLTDILVGNHNFTIRLTGYNDTVGTTTVQGGLTSYIYTSLSPSTPTTGSISISSIPTGARIFLALSGDILVDQEVIAPATITDLGPGNYDILLRLSGYEDFITTITANPGETSYLSAILMESPILVGSINFTSIPAGAEIFLALIGQPLVSKGTTPRTISDLPIGNYDFRLSLDGHNDVVGIISVVGGLTSYIFATMAPTTLLTGSISISSIPQGADVYIDDNLTTQKTPTTIADLDPGTYTVKLKKEGYQDIETIVNVTAGQTTYVGLTLSTKVVMAAFPWWILLGLTMGSYYVGKEMTKEVVPQIPAPVVVPAKRKE